ncbi:hypothetical protein GO491_04100 [Flavobacteriaceae bacterium Ap0902]|nr:hypothetical protein [Flavobacteriaceae bacterium Ap0902]
MAKAQVKTRKRVADHGEVFTNAREVNAMLDLVKDQCDRLEATFLEPACGDGNFLIEILNRKLLLLSRYKRNADLYNPKLIVAVSSIYGVELLEDNAKDCRKRLYNRVVEAYPKYLKSSKEYPELLKTIDFILKKNIICGNALDYTKADGSPIIFYQWQFINTVKVKIRCFDFEVVAQSSKQTTMFDEYNQPQQISTHNQEFKPIHYLKLYTYAD